MSDSKVRQWCCLFKQGRTNVHEEERSGQPSVIKDDLVVEKVNTTIRGNRCFTISELSLEFPQVSRSVIYNIVSEKLGYKKTVCQMGAENVNRRTQAEMPGCSSSIFATPSNWRRSVFRPYCHWRWDVDFLHKHGVSAMAPLIVPESKEVQASIFSQKNHGHRFLGQKGDLAYWFSRTWIDN